MQHSHLCKVSVKVDVAVVVLQRDPVSIVDDDGPAALVQLLLLHPYVPHLLLDLGGLPLQ